MNNRKPFFNGFSFCAEFVPNSRIQGALTPLSTRTELSATPLPILPPFRYRKVKVKRVRLCGCLPGAVVWVRTMTKAVNIYICAVLITFPTALYAADDVYISIIKEYSECCESVAHECILSYKDDVVCTNRALAKCGEHHFKFYKRMLQIFGEPKSSELADTVKSNMREKISTLCRHEILQQRIGAHQR